jgi:UDP-galactopyranose mutase
MSRFAQRAKVYFFEEPIFDSERDFLEHKVCPVTGVDILTPHLSPESDRTEALGQMLARFAAENNIGNPIAWFYTPMALQFFPASIQPSAVIYDCMDELSLFRGAPPEFREMEDRLLSSADLVFTGGVSLFEAKRHRHPRVYAFPSGVDVGHFVKARGLPGDYDEHKSIPRPRLGYAGVIDERIDLELIAEVAAQRPDWHLVMIGPTAKIDSSVLPRRENIHWLGMKNYADLPNYFAGWDVGIMPFALNDATRFISPTKTPEYLSAGLPVVSTSIRDVVRPYGELGLARIADSSRDFVEAIEHVMNCDRGMKWRERADKFLESLSWDSVWAGMDALIEDSLHSESRSTSTVAGQNEQIARGTGDPIYV